MSSAMLRLISRSQPSRSAAVLVRRHLGSAAEVAQTQEADVVAPTPGATAGATPRVQKLVDDLVSLNMIEVKALTDALKDRLGIEDSMAMPMMNPAMFAGQGAPGAASADAAAAAPEPEKTAFDIKLDGFDAGKKIGIIKEIRSLTSLGLKEAKALVDEAPKVIKTAVPKEEAEQIRDKLKELGAEIVLE